MVYSFLSMNKEHKRNSKNSVRLPRHSINTGGKLLIITAVRGTRDMFYE